MTYCYRCGRRLAKHHRICPHCGTYAHRHGYKSNMSGIVIRLIIIAILGVLTAVVIVAINPAERIKEGKTFSSEKTRIECTMDDYATNEFIVKCHERR